MARFRSRFEIVYRVRTQEEQRAQREVSEALMALRSLVHEKAKMIQDREASAERRESLPKIEGPINRFQIEDSFIEGAKVRIQQIDYKIHRAEKRYLRLLDVFQEKQKNRKMIEKLMEKEKENFRSSQKKKEQKELDDLSTMRRRGA